MSAKSEHLTVVSCVRRCSITTRLPCVAEGGSFFAAADPAGERAPFETIGRYAFFHVRRACAPVVGSRKYLFLIVFLARSSVGGKMRHLGPSHDGPCLSCRRNVIFAP